MKHLWSRAGFVRLGVALVLVLGLVVGGFAFFWGGGRNNKAKGAEENKNDEVAEVAIDVKMVRPHYDKSFQMIERRPADVQAYYQADLETRVPGLIAKVNAAAGTVVKKGEVLIEVDVPDLKAKDAQQEAAYNLTLAQVEQAKAAVKSAKAEVKVALSRIESTVAKYKSDVAYYKFRVQQSERFAKLWATRSIDEKLVDEQEDRRLAAFEAKNAAKEAVATAKATHESAVAQKEQAEADLKAALSKVNVAKAEWDYAKAMLDYSTVEAPFDGVVVRRNVDPGFFVQRAATGHATPLLIVQRNDIVTVVVRVPDNYATFITPNTEAIFETQALPGVKIHGKVTRYPQSLANPEHDRTMRVEVDLWNGDRKELEKLKNDPKFRADLKPGMPDKNDPHKRTVGLPIPMGVEGKLIGNRQLRLLPGMFGQMTLVLHKFDNVYMLPSSSVVTMGGYTYIYVVQKDNKAHLQPVKVQVDDGKLVKVELLDDEGQSLGNLSGDEQVIVSNQGELSEGQLVKPVQIDNWRSLDDKKDKK